MDTEALRVALYGNFAERGEPGTAAQLAAMVGATQPEVGEGLAELAVQRHVVLDDSGRIVMAHPFATIPLGFSVMGTRTLWWGGCAWDSFALPHLPR